jgi:hypothetical protein
VLFWTWLWGPVGLLLATPLTVCLIVLSKHLPALGFIVVLMGDRPVIEAKARYYLRLLARDQDEAADIVEAYVNADGRGSVYDAVLLPALYYAKQDRDRGLLSEDDAQFVGQATREILDVLAHDAPALSERDPGDLSVSEPGETRVRILVCPARDEADAVALEMVRHLLDPAQYRIEVSGTGMLTAEVVAWVDLQSRPDEKKTEDHAEDNPALNKVIERNIRTIIRLRLKAARERTVHDRVADTITSLSGRMGFAYVHIVWFGLWILLNTGRVGVPAFDHSRTDC